MKLTRKHIGQLFDNHGDGSWVYLLVDLTKDWLFFYCFANAEYTVIATKENFDWTPFNPRLDFHPRQFQKLEFKRLIEKERKR